MKYISRIGMLAVVVILVTSGCSHTKQDSQFVAARWSVGDYAGAAAYAKQRSEEGPQRDKLLWLLEEGAALRYMGEAEQSTVVFDAADKLMAEYDKGPSVSVSGEASAVVTNLSFLPYRGTAYDRIMVNTYKALNALESGDPERARVELNRALEQQRNAVRINAERLEKAREEAKELAAKENLNPDEVVPDAEGKTGNSETNQALQSLYVSMPGMEAYANYVNPFTSFLDALYFQYYSTGSSDLERSRVSWERVFSMNPKNHYLAEDVKAIQNLLNGKRGDPVTYLVVENGMAPMREENRIDLPLFIVTTDVPYIGVNFPSLKFQQAPFSRYLVTTKDFMGGTEPLSNMDNIIAQEFNQELPIIITKTIVAATAKAVAQYAIKESTKNAGVFGALVQVGAIIYQYAMNQADLRTWISLPKEFLYVRMPTPEEGEIMVHAVEGWEGNKLTVQVVPGRTNFIYLRVASPYSSPRISVTQLP